MSRGPWINTSCKGDTIEPLGVGSSISRRAVAQESPLRKPDRPPLSTYKEQLRICSYRTLSKILEKHVNKDTGQQLTLSVNPSFI